jgi:hypothetical protein
VPFLHFTQICFVWAARCISFVLSTIRLTNLIPHLKYYLHRYTGVFHRILHLPSLSREGFFFVSVYCVQSLL